MQTSEYHSLLLFSGLASSVVAMSMAALLSAVAAQVAGDSDFQNNCSACHSLDQGIHKFGPSLHGISGRTAGTASGYTFSSSYVEAGSNGVVWEAATLDEFLERPPLFLGRHATAPITNRMPVRVPNAATRSRIVEFLIGQKDIGGGQ